MSAVRMSPYLSFHGNAAEAVEHYRSVFDGTVTSQTFGEFGMVEAPADADLVMHAQIQSEAGVVMCGDTPTSMRDETSNKAHHPICLWGDDEERLRRWWDGLADGGRVHVPLEKAPWGDVFGQLEDRFGVTWMFNVGSAG